MLFYEFIDILDVDGLFLIHHSPVISLTELQIRRVQNIGSHKNFQKRKKTDLGQDESCSNLSFKRKSKSNISITIYNAVLS